MNRLQLKNYDPFPISLGETRELGDFRFSFEMAKLPAGYKNGPDRDGYVFKIENIALKVTRESELQDGQWSTLPDHTRSAVHFLERVLMNRKRYNVRATTWAFSMTKQRHPRGYWRSQSPKMELIGCSNSSALPKEIPSGELQLDPNDAFITALVPVLEADRKDWMQKRRAFAKANPDKKNARTDTEDLIRTEFVMKTLPRFQRLEEAVRKVISGGDAYTVKDINKLENMINQFGTETWRLLRKHGKK